MQIYNIYNIALEDSLPNQCNTTSLVHHMTFSVRISEIDGCPPHSTTQLHTTYSILSSPIQPFEA